MNDEIRRARAYLLRVAEPPAPALAEFVAQHGPATAAEQVRRGDVPEPVARETGARHELTLADRDLDEAERLGARLVIPEDDEWPTGPLGSLDRAERWGAEGMAAPIALWVRGPARLNEAAEQAVAIVGSRAATEYGEHTAGELAYALASHGVAVLSGAAYGIDGAAHRGSLAAGGVTVAVLGCALDAGYPAGHVGLLNRAAERGAVVSEYPPGTPPARHRLLVRNRLLAALTAGTVVVEAGVRSAARNTAATAAALDKPVMAVPGPISSAMSADCHDLIRAGTATLINTADHIIDAIH